MLKTIILSRILSLVFLVFSFNLAHSQTERKSPANDSLFAVNAEKVSALIETIESSLVQGKADARFDECFLSLDDALNYTKFVYQGTENGNDSIRYQAISLFYNKISNQAKQQLLAYQGDLKSIELFGLKKRFGATGLMKVIIISLNMELNDGNKQGIRFNIVETGNGYKILNFED